MRQFFIAAILIAASAVYSGSFAEPLCVVCTGPDQTYACELEGGDAAKTAGARLLCLREIADRHGHQSCSVSTMANCYGKLEIVRDGDIADVQLYPAPAQANASQLAPAAPAEQGQSFSDTAKQTMHKTGEAIVGTGQAVGEAAKKTWACIGSGFKECWK